MDEQAPDPRNLSRSHPQPSGNSADIRCLCGYDLTTQTIGSNCPECGRIISRDNLSSNGRTSGFAIASLVLGILSIPGICCYGVPGLLFGILAIVFFVLAKKQMDQGEASEASRPMAKAGLICGIIGLFLAIVAAIATIAFVIWVNKKNKQSQQQIQQMQQWQPPPSIPTNPTTPQPPPLFQTTPAPAQPSTTTPATPAGTP